MKISVLDQAPISTGMTAGQALQNSIDIAKLADQLGYNRYWLAEHHGMPSIASPAPEVMLARIGGETTNIRIGSGGIMLPHYAPLKVVEQFRVLHALYPDRVDLGVGRAPGGSQLEAMALMRDRTAAYQADDFMQQLAELRGLLNKDLPREHVFSRIKVTPDMPGAPDVWLLGSSMWSSAASAHFSLPFAFAHFFSGDSTRAAVEQYRANYKPSAAAPRPYAMIAIGVICADTDEEAARLAASGVAMFRRFRRGVLATIPSPEEAIAELAQTGGFEMDDPGEWPRTLYGTPDKVKAQLEQIAADLQLDEIMAVTTVFDHQARRRSYELLAQAMGLNPPH